MPTSVFHHPRPSRAVSRQRVSDHRRFAALGALAMPAFSADAKRPPRKTRLPLWAAAIRPAGKRLGPVGTYVAKRSATGTKTDTPIEKNPQSVSW